ncbi:hypothetical protein MGLY_28390 [Neomoorella glycerini]|uniref:HTH cro/C1-type domain-containing protein n=1 Tax=Neomoorella glycerini TaxID=55779 RepID=A0A6I5ZVT5_9FIRM|nr:helix-turn-helix transcriptional regulator [Moorella glycerini]QGP93431.1 hypothetical protein MGLY_28390 [Moorella glycerini]
MNFGALAKERMGERGLRPCDLARLTGYSQQYISDLISGRRRWNETAIKNVYGVLGLKLRVITDEGLSIGEI